MSKELVIGSNRHETKVAVLEDDQLVEVYFQRANEYSLAGSIHKGRVTRVLPGMQSAFVDLGLERDTFLYVSDFFEEQEDIDTVSDEKPARERSERNGNRGFQDRRQPVKPITATQETPLTTAAGASEEALDSTPGEVGEETRQLAAPAKQGDGQAPEQSGFRGERGRRSKRRRQRGRGFPENKYAHPYGQPSRPEAEALSTDALNSSTSQEDTQSEVILLPGESLAKYRHISSSSEVPRHEEEPPEERENASDAADDRASEEELAEEAEEIALADRVFAHHDEETAETTEEGHAETGSATSVGLVNEENKSEASSVSESITPVTEVQPGSGEEVAELDPVTLPEKHEPSDTPLVNQEPIALDEYEVLAIREGLTGIDEPLLDALPAEEAQPEESATDPAAKPDEAAAPAENQAQTASLREQNGRYMHRLSRRMRRRRGGNRSPQHLDQPEGLPEARRPESAGAGTAAGAAPVLETRGETQRERQEEKVTEKPERVYPSISDLLKTGQEIIVQIAKEPLGQKGARITSHIALPGRYVVFMPSVNHLGVSRKVASDEERQRLKRILQAHRPGPSGGFIVRTVGEGVPEEQIAADMSFLYSLWLDIREKAEKKPAPALLHYDLDVVQRILRDQVTNEFKAIWVDDEELYENVVTFMQRFQPALVNRVKMYTRDTPIFDAFNITQELEKALRPKVWLKSGGYIVINQTEALVAIDINTGKYVGKSNRLEDTIVKTNTEAVKEIVRQIRLRDLGGIIVVDFIDMDERKNRQKVMQALEEAMRADKAPYKILQFNDFGLVAITRKRVKQSLERALCSPCPYCEAAGYVKSVQTVISEILVEAQKLSRAIDSKDVVLRVHPEVAKVLKASNNRYLEELEEILRRPVLVTGDPTLHHQKFDLA
jgi:ribonuclease G